MTTEMETKMKHGIEDERNDFRAGLDIYCTADAFDTRNHYTGVHTHALSFETVIARIARQGIM
jgi:hypothetical protein